ncbi:ABC transporter ATP-binding protein [Chitinophaga silvatica]|uniref:ABC transporter ATP-binding protein n=1 Tax=Chitinophaga silvatica TaxID=2282649 RepID=A0A3E1Y930_9BACT|nr:ABC transporter ATP-binding protein [Chitinophaga silvatica]RFS21959.1 ABC transporter ATP-binding protein [Chitinophaga silvatica]
MNFLEVDHISKEQHGGYILKDVSFTQQQFQKLVIAGETGSGKSTLMKIAGGMAQADSGTVMFEGKRVKGALEVLIPGHPGTAYLSQHFELRNNYRVEEILSYANKLTDESAQEVFDVCRITHLLKRKTDQLSGGEKQRIAMARLLIGAPKLFLLDEPYSNLDMIHKSILKNVIQDIGDKLGITCMLVSHDPQDILPWADVVLIMKDGTIVQQGSPYEIYNQPVNEYVGGLLGKYNLLTPQQASCFKDLPGLQFEKSLFIRPEDLSISKARKEIVKGKVVESLYYGSYYDITVKVENTFLVVRSSDGGLKPGASVNIAVNISKVWYL